MVTATENGRAIQLRELDERIDAKETARIMGIPLAAVKARGFMGEGNCARD